MVSGAVRNVPTKSHRGFIGVRSTTLLADAFIVIGVRADPEPGNAAFVVDAESTVMQPDASRPELAHVLELN